MARRESCKCVTCGEIFKTKTGGFRVNCSSECSSFYHSPEERKRRRRAKKK